VWLGSEFNDGAARFSPDKRFVAYVSDSTGEPEVWIRPFPGPGAPVRVSQGGGAREPTWSSDGSELYFQAGPRMMAVQVLGTNPTVQVSTQRELFSGGFMAYQPMVPRTYDVLPDGRFVMVQLEGKIESSRDIAVVLNWTEELKRLVPTK
jgi:serine/threonine-protein kinase